MKTSTLIIVGVWILLFGWSWWYWSSHAQIEVKEIHTESHDFMSVAWDVSKANIEKMTQCTDNDKVPCVFAHYPEGMAILVPSKVYIEESEKEL